MYGGGSAYDNRTEKNNCEQICPCFNRPTSDNTSTSYMFVPKSGNFENEEDRIIYETLLKQYQGKLTLKNYSDFQELSSRIRRRKKNV